MAAILSSGGQGNDEPGKKASPYWLAPGWKFAKVEAVSEIPPQENLSAFKLRRTVGPGKTLEQSLKGQSMVIIGRGKECDVVVEDLKASRQHCRLTRQEDAFLLEDLTSKNGTYVEGVKITAPVLLKRNQSFKIGDTMFYLAS